MRMIDKVVELLVEKSESVYWVRHDPKSDMADIVYYVTSIQGVVVEVHRTRYKSDISYPGFRTDYYNMVFGGVSFGHEKCQEIFQLAEESFASETDALRRLLTALRSL